MATVDRRTAEAIVEKHAKGKGASGYVKIVRYENQFNGGEAFGLVDRRQDLLMYERSGACHNVQTWWTLAGGRTEVA